MHMKPTNISEEEKTRIFEESLKNQTPYIEKEPVKIQPVDKWIDAQINPPIATDGETSDYVLVLRTSGRQCVCYYVYDDGGNYWCSEDEKSMYDIDEVTHWQPLPEPPNTNKRLKEKVRKLEYENRGEIPPEEWDGKQNDT